MFEEWVGDVITRFVGHFLDVRKDQLRVSLWSGWSTGLTLENVRLKVEAFEYLQLPFNITEGRIGRLVLQVPWRALQSQPVLMEMSDVWLSASPRQEEEWEEASAGQRAQASKQAELAARDLMRLSRPGIKGAAGAANLPEGSSSGWPFLSHLSAMLLNRLQMTITNFHVCFQEPAQPGMQPLKFGLRLSSLQTEKVGKGSLGTIPSGAQVIKDMRVDGLSIYWCPAQPIQSTSLAEGPINAWLGAMEEPGANKLPLEMHDILPPLFFDMRLTTQHGDQGSGSGLVVGVSTHFQRLAMCVQQSQLVSMMAFAKQVHVWRQRGAHATLRPAGWRSQPDSKTSPRLIWRFAIRAVLQDLGKQRRWLSLADITKRRQQRLKYQQLYMQRLQKRSDESGTTQADELELEALEAQLSVYDILLFRTMAERKAQGPKVSLDVAREPRPKDGSQEGTEAIQRNWLSWSVTSVAGYIGWVPGKDAPSQPAAPSDEDIRGLYEDLDFDPKAHENFGRHARSALGIKLSMHVNAVILTLSEDVSLPELDDVSKVLSLEFGDLESEVSWLEGHFSGDITAADIMAHDLSSLHLGTSDTILTRWTEGDKMVPLPSMDLPSPFADPLSSFLLGHDSSKTPQEAASAEPALHISMKGPSADTTSDRSSRAPILKVVVQPLQLSYQPACFARLAQILASSAGRSHAQELLGVISSLESPQIRALSTAELALDSPSLPELSLEMLGIRVLIGQEDSTADAAPLQAALACGPVRVCSKEASQSQPAALLVEELRGQISGSKPDDSWQALNMQIEEQMMYSALDYSLEGLEVTVSGNLARDSEHESSRVLFPLSVRGSVRLCKLLHPRLPRAKVQLSSEPIELAVVPQHLQLLKTLLPQPQKHVSGMGVAETPEHQGAQAVELHASIGGIVATYDDGSGRLADAADTHLGLHVGPLSISVDGAVGALRLQAQCGSLQLDDRSNYTVLPPRIWGLIPRLASRLSVERINAIFTQKAGHGFTVSAELLEVESTGFKGEPGNFISRLRRAPPVARVTFTDTSEARKTSITLQDGCFGAGALMRIAAMFVRPEQPGTLEGVSDLQLQAAPVFAGASAKSHALLEAEPLLITEATRSQRADSTASLSEASAFTAPAEGSVASPGQNSASSQSRNSSFLRAGRPSGSSSQAPFEDILESPEGLAGTAPDGSSRPSSRNTNSSGMEPPAAASHDQLRGPSEDHGSDAEEGPVAIDAAATARTPEGTDPSAIESLAVNSAAASRAAPQQHARQKPDQFSLEILACTAVCPDWQSSSSAAGGAFWDRQHALTLSVPQLLLQLPAADPAQHPPKHPVELHNFDSASSWDHTQHEGPQSGLKHADGGKSMDQDSSTDHAESRCTAHTVVSAVQLAFHVEVFDPGKPFQTGHSRPFISIPDLSVTHQGLRPAPVLRLDGQGSTSSALLCTEAHMAELTMDIAPGRMATLMAAIDWGKSELAHILGQTEEQLRHMRRPRSLSLLSSLLQLNPVAVVGTIARATLRLRGGSPTQPMLQLEMSSLKAEAVRLPDEPALELSVQLPELLLSLTGLPESPKGESAATDELHDKAPQSPRGFGRSASAPSPPLRRAESSTVSLEPITPWMPDDTADFQSNSSVGSGSSPASQLGDRTASTGLAEATMLGSSPDDSAQPVFTARQASGALSSLAIPRRSSEGSASPLSSRRSSVDSAGSRIRFHDSRSGTLSAAALQQMSSRGSTASSGNTMYDAHSTASSLDSGSLVSPSGSGLLFDARSTASTGTSGDGMHDAPSSAFSNSLHRLSSDGTNASSGSGTEWFEAGDADSDAVSRSGSFRRTIEGSPEPEQAHVGRRLNLALVQAADSSAAGMLGHAEGEAGSMPGGCALLRVADAEGETSSAAHLGPAMLRVFAEGWELVRDVLEGYENILKNIPRRIDSKDRRLRRADHHIGLAQSKHSLMVHLLVIDIIATGSAGNDSRLPYAIIELASQLDVRMSGAALIELTMANFRAALGLGTAGPDCDIRVPEKHAAGLLCALRTGQGIIRWPSSAADEGLIVSADFGKLALWASQRRLCLALSLLAAAKGAAMKLDFSASNKAGQARERAPPGALLAGSLDLSLHSAVLCLSAETGSAESPLAELCLRGLQGKVDLDADTLDWELGAQLAVSTYSALHAGWEPVLEPWRFQTSGVLPVKRSGARLALGTGVMVGLQSEQVLNLTGTYTVFEAMEASRVLIQGIHAAAAAQTDTGSSLTKTSQPGSGVRPGSMALQRVENKTGLPLHCWIAPPGQEAAEGTERVSIEPGSMAALSSGCAEERALDHGSAGDMACFFSDKPRAPALNASASMAMLHMAVAKRRAKPPKLMLYYTLMGQQGPANTVPLSRDAHGFHSIGLRPAAGSGIYRVSVAYDVTVCRHTEATVTLHSGVQIVNSTMLTLNVGEQSSVKKAVLILATIAPAGSFCMPVLRKEPGLICFRPAGSGAPPEESQYQWTPSVRLQPLLDSVEANVRVGPPRSQAEQPRIARHLSCQATQSGLLQASFCIGVTPSQERAGWNLIVKAPLVLENMLPMPAEVLVRRKPAGQSPMRVLLHPKQLAYLHHTDIHHLDGIVIQAQGYQKSAPVRVPTLQRSSEGTGGMQRAASMDGDEAGRAVTLFQVAASGDGGGSTTVQLAHTQDRECGGHILQLSCGLWVYNCTGMPLALLQGDLDDSRQQEPNEAASDEVPKDWLPPYKGEGTGNSLFWPDSARRAVSKSALPPKREGMQQVVSSRRAGEATSTPTRSRSTSRFGLTESLEGLPSYSQPSRWPSMRGSAAPGRRRLRMQLRISNMRAPYGRTFWSEPLQLDSLGGAAIVSVPCPGPSPSYAQPDARAAYALSVTASKVPGSSGTLAVMVMPRYVLRNCLAQSVQFRQQETLLEKELAPGASRPLRWTDAALPRRLSVRIQDAGWLWSGGFALDTPGDIFVNIRHRDRGETRLVRVDICSTKGGVLVVSMSHQAGGFAPYRLDNCSTEVLHVRQLGCDEQQDIMRPYSTINYAWDEPSQPHKLILSLPGNRILGVFELDKVGFNKVIGLPGDYSYQWKERQLMVMIAAEGPTCVLTIVDLQKHEIADADDAESGQGERLGWQQWSSAAASKGSAQALQRGTAVSAPLLADLHVDLAGIGVSLNTPEVEVLYLLLDGIRSKVTSGKVRRTMEICIRSIQVDNPQRGAIFPVGFLAPAPVSALGFGMLPESGLPSTSAAKAPAVCARVAVWRRMPAGVLCYERLEVNMGPAILEVDQQHLDQVLAALQHALSSLSPLLPSAGREEAGSSDVDGLVASYIQAPLQERKVYIACMHVSPISITLSFLPAELQRHDALTAGDITGTALGTGLQRLVALVGEVEGGRLSLAALHMEHPLLGTTALQQQIQSHYLRAALPEIVKLVGSANVLGDPARLIHHLGLGVWSFLASPASGLVEGARRGAPERIAAGVVDGTRSLITNTVYAFSNATAKMSGTARKGLAALGLEPAESRAVLPLRARLRSRARDAALDVNPGLLGALLNGLVGIISEPVRGAEQGGLPGLLRGASRGAAGVLVQPLAFALETSVAVADSLRSAIMGIPPLLPRARPPRLVSPQEPLAVYNWSEAMGRALLLELERGRHAGEGFLLCRQLAAGVDFAVLTEQNLLCIAKPLQSSAAVLRWAVALRDVLHFDRDLHRLRLVSLPPSAVRPARTLALLRRPLVVRSPAWPFFSASLLCQSTEDAEMLCGGLQYTTRHGRALTFSPVLERQVLQSVQRSEGSHELMNESF